MDRECRRVREREGEEGTMYVLSAGPSAVSGQGGEKRRQWLLTRRKYETLDVNNFCQDRERIE